MFNLTKFTPFRCHTKSRCCPISNDFRYLHEAGNCVASCARVEAVEAGHLHTTCTSVSNVFKCACVRRVEAPRCNSSCLSYASPRSQLAGKTGSSQEKPSKHRTLPPEPDTGGEGGGAGTLSDSKYGGRAINRTSCLDRVPIR